MVDFLKNDKDFLHERNTTDSNDELVTMPPPGEFFQEQQAQKNQMK